MGKLDNLRKRVWEVNCGGNYKLALLFLVEKTRLGVAKVKVQDIADACNISKPRAKATLAKLREEGFLHVVGNENGGNGQPRIYKITNKEGIEFVLPKGVRNQNPLYISVHKAVYANGKAHYPAVISANDAEIDSLLLAGGL
jgi:predicted transcriptional regulator